MEPTPELLATYKTLADCAGDLAKKYPPEVIAKAVVNLAGRVLWDVVGIDGAQHALLGLADELPEIISEEGRTLHPERIMTLPELAAAGIEGAR